MCKTHNGRKKEETEEIFKATFVGNFPKLILNTKQWIQETERT
jgi:hypothetical protein